MKRIWIFLINFVWLNLFLGKNYDLLQNNSQVKYQSYYFFLQWFHRGLFNLVKNEYEVDLVQKKTYVQNYKTSPPNLILSESLIAAKCIVTCYYPTVSQDLFKLGYSQTPAQEERSRYVLNKTQFLMAFNLSSIKNNLLIY